MPAAKTFTYYVVNKEGKVVFESASRDLAYVYFASHSGASFVQRKEDVEQKSPW